MEAQTPRQAIADVLRSGPCTALDVAHKLGMPLRRVVDDLEHVRRSVRSPERWTVEPAECLACGFVYRGRERIDLPSRCPECHGEEIQPAKFGIERA